MYAQSGTSIKYAHISHVYIYAAPSLTIPTHHKTHHASPSEKYVVTHTLTLCHTPHARKSTSGNFRPHHVF